MSLEACSEQVSHPLIKVEEYGKKAIIINGDGSLYTKIKVDGCLINNGIRADWAIQKEEIGTIIIELKGSDVEKAADQVLATAAYWRSTLQSTVALAGLIVCSQYPKASATIQKKQALFAKNYKGPLRVINKQANITMEQAFKFK